MHGFIVTKLYMSHRDKLRKTGNIYTSTYGSRLKMKKSLKAIEIKLFYMETDTFLFVYLVNKFNCAITILRDDHRLLYFVSSALC